MSALEMFRCSKNFPHPDGDQAVELLVIEQRFGFSGWEAKPRCAEHPAADDIPLLRKLTPGIKCAVVPLDGAS